MDSIKRSHKKHKLSENSIYFIILRYAHVSKDSKGDILYLIEPGRRKENITKFLTEFEYILDPEVDIISEVIDGEEIMPYIGVNYKKLKSIIMEHLSEQICGDRDISREWRGETLLYLTDREKECKKKKSDSSKTMSICVPVNKTSIFLPGTEKQTFIIFPDSTLEDSNLPIGGKMANFDNILNTVRVELIDATVLAYYSGKKIDFAFNKISFHCKQSAEMKKTIEIICSIGCKKVSNTADKNSSKKDLEKA
jgi:hypothetical protein